MGDYRKLKVWEKAHALALSAYELTRTIRGASTASVRSQIVRAAVSVPANIVEGSDQKSRRDFARFLRYSVNSANELEYHITFVRDAGIVTSAEVEERLNAVAEVRKMLTGLIKRIDEDSD